ncbi:MAG TPA: type II toxin-antitoxin system prevent-host-death family antitoxin [Solimonas sp.]|nr:type II toxin-antitoxin system prevent-host-death family antitoxin [Solimonas sp.]
MRTINYATARQHLAETMDAVNNDRTPILITRQRRIAAISNDAVRRLTASQLLNGIRHGTPE